jgi:mannonate dehydratase
MKITDVKIIICSPGRNFVTVKIFTDEGLTGVGDATLNGRELAVAAYLRDHLAPLLIGRDPSRIEDIWQYFYRGAYWRRGPVTMAAIAGIDTALWDIKAKAANMPLYQLLGGASREKVLCYTHAQGRDIAEAVEAVAHRKEQGYKAIRVQVGIPGLPDVYGTGAKSVTNNALDDAVPHEETWSTSKYLRYVPELFKAVRDAHGWDIELLHDTHHRLTPIEAARLGKDLEFARLFWKVSG